jgi:metal-responsive CopG/Arc/MetJ family transcriptional regulator
MESTAQGHSPPVDRLVSVKVNLPQSLVDQLDQRTGLGRSRSSIVRDILEASLGAAA